MAEAIDVKRVARKNPKVDLSQIERVRAALRKLRAVRSPKRYDLQIPFTRQQGAPISPSRRRS